MLILCSLKSTLNIHFKRYIYIYIYSFTCIHLTHGHFYIYIPFQQRSRQNVQCRFGILIVHHRGYTLVMLAFLGNNYELAQVGVYKAHFLSSSAKEPAWIRGCGIHMLLR